MGGLPPAPRRPPPFPLTLDRLVPQDPSVPTLGAPRPRTLALRHRGALFSVSVWIGEGAPSAATAALERTLASLRFVEPRRATGGLQRCDPK